MATDPMIFALAAAAGIALQLLIRFSSRVSSRWGKLLLNIGKGIVLLLIQFMMLRLFAEAGDGSLGSVIASCVTFLIAAGVLIMQYFSDRKYPMTDVQKMNLANL